MTLFTQDGEILLSAAAKWHWEQCKVLKRTKEQQFVETCLKKKLILHGKNQHKNTDTEWTKDDSKPPEWTEAIALKSNSLIHQPETAVLISKPRLNMPKEEQKPGQTEDMLEYVQQSCWRIFHFVSEENKVVEEKVIGTEGG